MTDIPEFIVESVDILDETWKFFNELQGLNNNLVPVPSTGIAKKFTSLATNATIFRWKFGDQPGNPTIETTVNPYIHTFISSGTYSISHQSCYPCIVTGTLICSIGWCTKSVKVAIAAAYDSGPLVALAGFAGLFLIAKGDNCCDIRKKCAEKREICKSIKPEDIKNTKECEDIEKVCIDRLEDCREKCVKTGNIWKPLSYKCLEKNEPYKEICQVAEQQNKYKKQQTTDK
jgi:hypothetical protein